MKNVIYKISNSINNKIYIGSSAKFNLRYNQHKFHLLNKTHHNRKLQNHVNKYGFESLIFEVIEKNCTNLIEREQFYIDDLNPFFNIRKIANSNFGLKRTESQKKYMLNQRMLKSGYKSGWNHSEQSRMKISESNKGKIISEEQKNNHSLRMKGFIVKNETKLKISNSLKGKVVTDKTRKKLSEQKMGNKNPMFGKKKTDHHNFGKKFKHKNPKKSQKIIDLNTGLIYDSIKILSKSIDVPAQTLYKYVSGRIKKIKNFKYYED